MIIKLRQNTRVFSVFADAPKEPIHFLELLAGQCGECVHIASGYALLHFKVDGKLYTTNQPETAFETLKAFTTYGECPACGQSCQPDVVGSGTPDKDGFIEEYAVCCDCELVWNYLRDTTQPEPEVYEERWEPTAIETFDTFGQPYECE